MYFAGQPERLPQPDGSPLGWREEQRDRSPGARQCRIHRAQNQFSEYRPETLFQNKHTHSTVSVCEFVCVCGLSELHVNPSICY